LQAQTQLYPQHSGLTLMTEATELLPPPETGSVRVWQLNLDALSGFTTQLEAMLSPDERERAHAFATPQLRQRFIGGRGALRLILGACCAKAPEQLAFSYGPYGKPALTGSDAVWKFNLAHSQHMALIAVSRHIEIGVDIEIDRPLPDLAGLMALCFSKQQRNACLTLSRQQQLIEFYRTWTCKEALVKASGEGLQIDLPELEIAEDGTVLRWPAKLQAYSGYRVHPLPQLKIPAALALGPGLTDWQCEEFPLPALERWFEHDVNRGKRYV
jgi:4'-phosphopantetheinyl transferase